MMILHIHDSIKSLLRWKQENVGLPELQWNADTVQKTITKIRHAYSSCLLTGLLVFLDFSIVRYSRD
jgi:hypothetical protein